MSEDIRSLEDELVRLNVKIEDMRNEVFAFIMSIAKKYRLNLVLEKVPKKVHKN